MGIYVCIHARAYKPTQYLGTLARYLDMFITRESAPKKILQAVVDVVRMHGNMDEQTAEDYVRELEKTRRYLLDTWS